MGGISIIMETKLIPPNPNEFSPDIQSQLIKDHEDKILEAVVAMIDNCVYNPHHQSLVDTQQDIIETSANTASNNNYLKEGMRY